VGADEDGAVCGDLLTAQIACGPEGKIFWPNVDDFDWEGAGDRQRRIRGPGVDDNDLLRRLALPLDPCENAADMGFLVSAANDHSDRRCRISSVDSIIRSAGLHHRCA
jgi:hypothetical protein